jgi:ABC-type sugar transport system permease subunit
MGSRSAVAPYVLLAPFLLVFGAFTVYPLGRSLVLATERSFGPGVGRFVGLENFGLLLADPVFWLAARNTLLFTAGSVLVQLPLALLLALALNRPSLRGRAVYRLVYFSPQLMGLVFSGMLASLMFEKRTGLVNRVLHSAVGFDLDFAWLQVHVMPMLVITALWMYVGFNMVYFLAALQNVDRSLTEAAVIDGASPSQRFFHVTLPSIRPVATFVVLLSVIGSVQLFELPYIIFGQTPFGGSGPENRALTLVMYLYQQAFESGDLGYASAIGWVIAVFLFAVGLGQLALTRGEAS